jgi:hypothetical protein
LSPRADALNLEELLYRAGQQATVSSVRSKLVAVSFVSAVLASAASALLTVLLMPPSPAVQRIHLVRIPSDSPVVSPLTGPPRVVRADGPLAPRHSPVSTGLRNRMLQDLENGAFPEVAVPPDADLLPLIRSPADPPPYRQQLRQLLDRQV